MKTLISIIVIIALIGFIFKQAHKIINNADELDNLD